MTTRKARIAERFGEAALAYDEHSPLQRKAALQLAGRVRQLRLPPEPRVLEIGCGTGHLTRALLPALGGRWTVSDIAPAMVAACRATVGTEAADYFVMDGERPALAEGRFDLVVASLAAQWFADLPGALAALAALLAPGGCIALATLGTGTFAEWRAAHAKLGLAAGTPAFPDAATLARAFPAGFDIDITAETIAEPAADALEFLRGLRMIGAHTPAPGAQPLSAGQLRRVLRALDLRGGMRYELLYAIARRSSSTSQPRTTR